jgi:hypothetical protein
VANCDNGTPCDVKESSVNTVQGLGGELLRNADEFSSNAGVTVVLAEPVIDGGFADGRLAGAGTLRRLSLVVLALLFGVGLGAGMSLDADFGALSARAFKGSCTELEASATFDDEDLANEGVDKGLRSAVDGRLLELPSREEPGRLNGSSRRGGIMDVMSPPTTAEVEKGAVDGLW